MWYFLQHLPSQEGRSISVLKVGGNQGNSFFWDRFLPEGSFMNAREEVNCSISSKDRFPEASPGPFLSSYDPTQKGLAPRRWDWAGGTPFANLLPAPFNSFTSICYPFIRHQLSVPWAPRPMLGSGAKKAESPCPWALPCSLQVNDEMVQ